MGLPESESPCASVNVFTACFHLLLDLNLAVSSWTSRHVLLCQSSNLIRCAAQGVHAKGGPTTVDNKITLSSLADRTASDIRGIKISDKN